MKPFRCLLVDDERLARENLRVLLQDYPQWSVVGEAADVEQAVEEIRRLAPDVMFLDIQLPDGSGFDLLKRLEQPPLVVFVTAHDRYAVRAFEVNALDYVLKPVDPARFRVVLERALARKSDETRSELLHPIESADAVWLEIGASGHFRPLKDILAIEADGKYAKVYCDDGCQYLVRQSLGQWERRLPTELFARLERGLIINRTEIKSVQFLNRKASLTIGPGGRIFEVGRHAAHTLRRMLK